MAPGAPATARRGDPRALRRTVAEHADRPRLRVLEPSRRRRQPRRRSVRPEVWIAGLMVVGSLFGVVVGDAVVAQGQIRLTHTQQAITAATASEKTEQVAVAEQAAPPVVVHAAEKLGLVAPTSIVDLPTVPLNVPLPAPNVGTISSAPSQ